MSLCTYYDMLKQSPLAKGRDDATVEEVAIWLEMNGSSTRASITKMLKAIEKNFHDGKTDHLIDNHQYTAALQKILRNSLYGANSTMQTYASFLPVCSMQWLSDAVLYWLFKAISDTDVLDDAVLDKKFIDFAKKTRDKHREKITTYKKFGDYLYTKTSSRDEDLYEIFAELVDILEKKLTKRSQSLPS